MAMMTVAATALRGLGAASLAGIHASLGTALGGGAAVAFALVLLASGLASSSVGIQAGQVIMKNSGSAGYRSPPGGRSTTVAATVATITVLALNRMLLAQA